MIIIKLTPKNAKPGFFMNLEVEAENFDQVVTAVRTQPDIQGQRLHVEKHDNGSLHIVSRSPILVATSEIAVVQRADREFH